MKFWMFWTKRWPSKFIYFRNHWLPKTWLGRSKKVQFIRPYNKQHGKQSQTLLKYPQQHLYHIYWSLWKKVSWKESLLVIFKILGLLLNTSSTDDKYSLVNRENLTQSIQIKLSKKQTPFLPIFFFAFEIYIKFWTFWKQIWPS